MRLATVPQQLELRSSAVFIQTVAGDAAAELVNGRERHFREEAQSATAEGPRDTVFQSNSKSQLYETSHLKDLQ